MAGLCRGLVRVQDKNQRKNGHMIVKIRGFMSFDKTLVQKTL